LFSIFNQPTPLHSGIKKNLIRYASVGLFVALFLIIFQPFGTDAVQMDHKNIFLAGYGVIVMMTFMFSFIVIPRLFPGIVNEEKWLVWKQILLLVFTLILTFSICYIYQAYWFDYKMSFKGFSSFFITVFPISIFPCVVIALLDYIHKLKKHQAVAHTLNDQLGEQVNDDSLINFLDDKGRETFNIRMDHLLYVQAANNYIEINYLDEGEVKRELIRNTISKVESQIYNDSIVRCHRSYLVNMDKVGRITGNAQGYKIHFPFTAEHIVPVSRSKGKILLDLMKANTV